MSSSPSSPVTMHDVAERAGVSQSTVSRVLSNSPMRDRISQETINKVLAAAEELDYHPNLTARSLRGQKTYMIAIMIADISNPMYHTIVRTVQRIAREREYDVLIANSDHLYEAEQQFCASIIRRPVDGVLMVPFHLTQDDIQGLIDRTQVPIVLLAQPDYHPSVDRVYHNDQEATYQVIRWLVEDKGHQRVGFIGVSHDLHPGRRRYAAYVRALQDVGLPVLPQYISEGDFSMSSGQRAMRALLDQPEPPTAVFVCNDLMAIGAIDTANDMQQRIPEDVAIVGFDNIPETQVVRPRLTTIAQHPVEVGQALARILFEQIDGADGAPQTLEIPCQLIERETT